MKQIRIDLKFGYKERAELVLALNGVSFPVEQLQVSSNGDYYQNRVSKERYKVVGNCQVNIDAIGKGVHYLLEDDEGRVLMLGAEGFGKNFVKV
ncbi:MAG: hypothetical protein ACOCUT_00940 [bacterium]